MRFLVTALTLALSAPAMAGGPNGGQVVMAEDHPVELVVTDTGLTFFVSEEGGQPIATAGLSGKAYIQAGGKTETVALKGAAPNRFVGDLKTPLPPGAKIVLSAKVHGHGLQARFER
ncbi:hypothetical protein ASG52_13410 [Methylobacterium sp. Leaf456]|uniref:hypothetical protein n=1 Tax=Methylobacterium sp. Leaf456 TaxID=1736382 RepID=UPI0006FBC9D0|nr:hypothetical protein [Methylobacterium sp. Leaf456]KQT46703.1 hypothetical protein ASG52_13410 [Methylobacterium sp. Leaf456]